MHRVLPITNPCRGVNQVGIWPSSNFSVAIQSPAAQHAAKRLVYNIHFRTGKVYRLEEQFTLKANRLPKKQDIFLTFATL